MRTRRLLSRSAACTIALGFALMAAPAHGDDGAAGASEHDSLVSNGTPTAPPADAARSEKGTEDVAPLTDDDLKVAQATEALQPLKDAIDSTIASQHLVGLATEQNDLATQTLTVYWKGSVPQAIEAIRVPAGLTLVIKPAEYTTPEMKAAVRRVTSAWPPNAESAGSGLRIDSIDLLQDGSGLSIRMSDSDQSGAAESPKIPDSVVSVLQSLAGEVRVNAVSGEPYPGSGESAGRTNDQPTAPGWYGGSRIHNPDLNDVCSSGYSVTVPSSGGVRVFTASHCSVENWDNGVAASPTKTWAIASHLSQSAPGPAIDSMAATTSTIAGAARVYTGVYNSTTYKKVAGDAMSMVGDSVCQSGASSGMHCSLTVMTYTYENIDSVWVWEAWNNSIGMTHASGDSGAPVFVQRTDGRVTIRGVLHGGLPYITCPPPPAINPDVTPECKHHLWFVGTVSDLNPYWGYVTRTES